METIERAVDFHGDPCQAFVTGIFVSELALREFGRHAHDNRLIAVVENETCAVDAIQMITGCTAGNRNLVQRDWGKIGYSFFRPADGRGIRISGDPTWQEGMGTLKFEALGAQNGGCRCCGSARPESTDEPTDVSDTKQRVAEEVYRMLSIDPLELFTVEQLDEVAPSRSRVDPFHRCDRCGEAMMETRSRHLEDQELCIPCFERAVFGGLRTLGMTA
jgi:formylmethanofuran dehydrogenase subunit E